MFSFTSSTIPSNVFIIGAGGTGGRLIPLLSQFLRSITRGNSPMGWLEKPRIWLIDDDVVEQKNILRQNFIDRDVGKHKAVVLADRYSRAYGVDIIPITMKIQTNTAQNFYDLVNNHLFVANGNIDTIKFDNIIGSSVVVMCVDSVEARRDILNVFMPGNGGERKTFFVDAGNEDNFGQVSFFTSTVLLKHEANSSKEEIPKLCPVSANVDYIPVDVNYYRGLVDTPAQGSCADLNQTLAINAIMATAIMGVLQNYFYRKPMTYNKVSISLDGGNHTTYNTFNAFNNAGITSSMFTDAKYGNLTSEEKNGSRKVLGFVARAFIVKGQDVRHLLLEQIQEMERQAEEARRKAEEERLEKEERIRIKEIADRKRAEIRAAVEAARRAREAPVAPAVETVAAVEALEAVTEATSIPEVAPSVPPLTPVSRSRRRRQVIELELPVEIPTVPPPINYEDGDEDDNEITGVEELTDA